MIVGYIDENEGFDICGWILIALSYVLVILTFPIAPCFCIKVRVIQLRSSDVSTRFACSRLFKSTNEPLFSVLVEFSPVCCFMALFLQGSMLSLNSARRCQRAWFILHPTLCGYYGLHWLKDNNIQRPTSRGKISPSWTLPRLSSLLSDLDAWFGDRSGRCRSLHSCGRSGKPEHCDFYRTVHF